MVQQSHSWADIQKKLYILLHSFVLLFWFHIKLITQFSFFFLTFFNISFRSICVVANIRLSFFFEDEISILFNFVYVCVYIHMYNYICINILYLFICWWSLSCFPIFVTVNNTAMNIRIHVSVQIIMHVFFRSIPSNWNSGPYLYLFLFFLRDLHTVFLKCINLHSQQQYIIFIFSPHPCKFFYL